MNWKYSIIIVSLLAMLVISLMLNYIFYKKAFIPLQAAKLDPIGLNYYKQDIAKDKKSDKPIVMFYGDSRGLSWPNPSLDQYQFINRSIGNQTSIQTVARFHQHVSPHRPKTIIIQVCVNDLKMIPLFPDKAEQIIANCKANLKKLLIQAQAIESKVILSTVFPLGEVTLDRRILGIKAQPIMNAIDNVNTYIRSLASKNVTIFDSYLLLKGEGQKVDKQYSHDWLHLNKKGYQYLNKHLLELLK